MRRRSALKLLAAALAASPAWALGAGSRVIIGRVRYPGGNWDPHPDALRRLVWEVVLRTSVQAEYQFPVVDLDSPQLYRTPLVYLSGDRGFPAWSEAARQNMARFLRLGGTLLVDDASGRPDSEFDRSLRREAELLLPGTPLLRLPEDHSLFRAYYLLRQVGGRVLVSPWVEALSLGDRAPLIYCRNDLGGAWARDQLGRWRYDCVPGGEAQRQAAMRLGVNVVLYALTVNYKQDQVHAPFIRRRRGR